MKCLFCTTELPVDGNAKTITCPKCGAEMDVRPTLQHFCDGQQIHLVPVEHPVYGEDKRYDSPTNY